MKKIELVDFLKGYSIFTIVIFHLILRLDPSPLVEKLISFGGTGVHTFLLISGFGLFLSYLGKPLAYGDFIRRRLSKMYIPYIIVVVISAICCLFIFIPLFKPSLYAFLGHVFLYKMFDTEIINSYGAQLWFVSTILQFYLIFHAIVWFRSRMSEKLFLVTGICLSIGWSVLLVALGKQHLRAWNSFFLQFIWEFMLGMIISERLRKGELKVSLSTFTYLMIGLAGIAIYGVLALKGGRIGKLFNDIPGLIGYTSLAIFLYSLGIALLNRFFIYTGSISYSIFLLHILINEVVIYALGFSGILPGYWMILPSLLLTYIISSAYQKFIAIGYEKMGI